MRRLMPLLLLAACAQTPTGPDPGSFVGRTEADVVSTLGVPNRVFDAGGARFLAYDQQGSGGGFVVPSLGFGVGRSTGGFGSSTGFGTGLGLSFGGLGGGGGGPCTTNYEIREGVVSSVTRQGPGCS